MNNLQKILELSKSKGYKSLCDECNYIMKNKYKSCKECSAYQVLEKCDCDLICVAEKLLEEYKEERKLSKRERAFCEYAQTGYIARDKNGSLFHFVNKPIKDRYIWHSCVNGKYIHCIDSIMFKFITWEDDEPYSVEEMLKWEVED